MHNVVTQLMRQGKTPQESVVDAVHRIVKKRPDY